MSTKQAVLVVNPNVGDITQADITTFVGQLTNIATVVSEGYSPMTELQRKHTPRARTAVIDAIPKVLALAAGQSVDAAAAARLEAIEAFLDLLAPLVTTAQGMTEILTDLVLVLQADASNEARSIYFQLKGKAKANPRLKVLMEPLAATFKTGGGVSKSKAKSESSDAASTGEAKGETSTVAESTTAAASTEAGATPHAAT